MPAPRNHAIQQSARWSFGPPERIERRENTTSTPSIAAAPRICATLIKALKPAGVGVLQWLLTALAGEYEMKLMLGVLTYSVSILLTFGVSLLVGFMVARKNKKIDMVEALKGAE